MIFLDSSFLVAYYNTRDVHNKRALELMQEFYKGEHGVFIISDYIFDEFINVFLSKYESFEDAKKYGNDVLNFTSILFNLESDFNEIWSFFISQKETTLNFTDCSIIFLMRNNGIKHIATFDKDFEKVKGIEVIS